MRLAFNALLKSVIFCIAVILFMPALIKNSVAQQVSTSVTNTSQYGIGTERGIFGKEDKEYFENFTDVRLRLDGLTLGFRYEVRKQAEFGPDVQGITKRYLQYQRDGLRLRAGDLFGIFNRGLAFNLFEDKVIRYDTGLDGLLAEYSTGPLKFTVVGGEISYLEQLTFEDFVPHRERHSIRAANVEWSPSRQFRLGGSFVRTISQVPDYPFNPGFSDSTQVNSHTPEAYMRLRLSSFDLNVGYAHKFNEVYEMMDTVNTNGGALYASLSHSGRGYAVTLEYKDYRYDIVDPLNDFNFLRTTRMMPFQNPPVVHKQHSYTLMSREPYLVNFNDETGFFLDAFINLDSRLMMNTSVAWASRHFGYNLDMETFEVSRDEIGSSWLPSTNRKRNPFVEFYVDVEYLFPDFISSLKVAYNYRNRYSYETLAPDLSFALRHHNFMAELNYSLTPIWSVKLISEHQLEYDGNYVDRADVYNQLITLQISRSPLFSIAGRYELSTSDDDPSGRKNWFFLEGSYRIGNSHTVSAGYGYERGGTVCTNGVCRVVNAFEGFRFSLVSIF